MSVAEVPEISATSIKSSEEAITQGIERANKTLRNVRSAWIKEQQVRVTKGAITSMKLSVNRVEDRRSHNMHPDPVDKRRKKP